MQRRVDNDDWNFDYFDKLMDDDEIPDEVKKDVAAMKEKHAEVKDELDKKKKSIDETIDKAQQLNDIIDNVGQWAKNAGENPILSESLSDKPDALKRKLKELQVFFVGFVA